MPKLKSMLFVVFLAIAAVSFYFYWQHEKMYPATEDAYLKANILTIAPQINGQIKEVKVSENQIVNAGDILFVINDDKLRAGVEAAEAKLTLATQSTNAGSKNVTGGEATVSANEAAFKNAQVEYERTEKLFKVGDVAKAALDNALAARNSAKAKLDAAKAALAATQTNLGELGDNNANVKAARANLEIAKINLAHATILAPASGWVSNITLRPGQFVQAGQPLFSIVENKNWWIDANFKETDISRIRPGQPATIGIDMYPGFDMTGTVESLGAGSGAVFSLIPAQNATGNWVKVTQRFSVRIKLDEAKNDPAFQLRAGASVNITVNTTSYKR